MSGQAGYADDGRIVGGGFRTPYPADAIVEVSRLYTPDAKIEAVATAD